nr:hypothetical protein Itr_chr11CG17110 [Ipomoea trifida]
MELWKRSECEWGKHEINGGEEGFVKATEALRSAREDALKEFKESEDFHEEVMPHASMHARTSGWRARSGNTICSLTLVRRTTTWDTKMLRRKSSSYLRPVTQSSLRLGGSF